MAFPPSRVETVMSPVSMRIASRYAEAFSQVLDEHQQAEASLEELRATTGLLNSIEGFEQLLTWPGLSSTRRVEMVERIFGGRVSRQTAGLLSVMAANSRMELLRPATARFAELLDERKGKVRVEVTTAFTLSQSQIEKITETLRNVLGAEPVVQNKVDGEVIGGMVLKLGDKVYDASLAAELDRLRRDMRRESKGRPTSKANGQ